jgi:hypothetical protein
LAPEETVRVARNRLWNACQAYQLLISLALIWAPAAAQSTTPQPGIQDNSFLVEEAYNQERGVVQHISTFSRLWNSKDWIYTFTQEWPVPRYPRHQLSYTLVAAHAGAFAGSGAGWGDVILHYRYQLVGNGGTRTAFSPRLSVLLPSGDETRGRGFGAPGIQMSLPLSVVLHRRLASHWNVGGTFVSQARDAMNNRADTMGYNLGQSFIWMPHPRFNVLMETVYASAQSVVAPDLTQWNRSLYLSPGIRWAYNFKNGLQIVPGIALPLGAGPSAGEHALFVYLSFEHPFGRRQDK